MSHIRFPKIHGLDQLLRFYFAKTESPKSLREKLPGNIIDLIRPYGMVNLVAHALGLPPAETPVHLATRSLALFTQAQDISSQFTAQSIPNIIIRGAWLLPLYPHPADRTFSDIDILIHPDYIKEALKLVKSWGATTEPKDSYSFAKGYWDGVQLFLPKPSRLLLELHVDLAPLKRFPNPQITQPPINAEDEKSFQALATMIHCSTHHYENPTKALCDLLLLATQELNWPRLREFIDTRRAWNAVNPFLLDFDSFAPGIVPHAWIEMARDSCQSKWIRRLADQISSRGGVYAKGSFWRRILITIFSLPDLVHAIRALMRGLEIRVNSSKIASLSHD